jgi:hypothetical protein
MDQITIKTPNPKCRLYLLTGSPPPPPPLPCVNKYRVMYSYSVKQGGRDRGPQTDKHLPPSTFTGKFFRKADS